MCTVGQILLDHYSVVESLGEGGQGQVCLVNDERTLYSYAAKIQKNPRNVQGVVESIDILRSLDHPNIIQLIDVGRYQDKIVTIYPVYQTQDRIDAKQIRPTIACLLSTLVYLERNRVVHGDIKPGNILYREKSPILIDFGSAKRLTGPSIQNGPFMVTTLTHRSPEQFLQIPIDTRTDVWSLGFTLFEIITGHVLIPDITEFKQVEDLLQNGSIYARSLKSNKIPGSTIDVEYLFRLVTSQLDEISDPEVNRLIRRMLTIDVRQRPFASQLMTEWTESTGQINPFPGVDTRIYGYPVNRPLNEERREEYVRHFLNHHHGFLTDTDLKLRIILALEFVDRLPPRWQFNLNLSPILLTLFDIYYINEEMETLANQAILQMFLDEKIVLSRLTLFDVNPDLNIDRYYRLTVDGKLTSLDLRSALNLVSSESMCTIS